MPERSTPARPFAARPGIQDRLDSWKEIADYLGREQRTVQRWERTEGLPVRRLQHGKAGSVYALRSELDAWMDRRSGLASASPSGTELLRSRRSLAGAVLLAAAPYPGRRRVQMSTAQPDPAGVILTLERAALERWAAAIPTVSSRSATRKFPTSRKQFVRFEMIEPRVQMAGDAAVLTFRFESHNGEGAVSWNTTEVYRKTAAGWRILHTHWAFYRPKIAA